MQRHNPARQHILEEAQWLNSQKETDQSTYFKPGWTSMSVIFPSKGSIVVKGKYLGEMSKFTIHLKFASLTFKGQPLVHGLKAQLNMCADSTCQNSSTESKIKFIQLSKQIRWEYCRLPTQGTAYSTAWSAPHSGAPGSAGNSTSPGVQKPSTCTQGCKCGSHEPEGLKRLAL